MSVKFRRINISLLGRTWGAAWEDVNGDRYPDLYISNHQAQGSVLINDGNGGFKATNDALPVLNRDTHGAVFGDFDNDGDADLMQVTGGSGGNRNLLYINDGTGKFTDQAQTFGVLSQLNRGRTPLWFDYDMDGDLDLGIFGRSQGNGQGESTLFRNDGNRFTDVSKQIGFNVPESPFGGLADLDNDDRIDFYVKNANSPWLNVYGFGDTLTDINQTLRGNGRFPSPEDVAAADFNGDLKTDLFFTRNRSSGRKSSTDVDNQGRVYASFNTRDGDVGIRFAGQDIFIRLFVELPEQSIEDVLIGHKGIPATEFDLKNVTPPGLAQTEYELRLSVDDPRVQGLSTGKGLFIGLKNNQWSVDLRGNDRAANLLISGNERFQAVEPIGFENSDFVNDDLLLLNDGTQFEVTEAGLNDVLGSGISVASGDFDNDMDVDLYILNSTSLANTENFMFLNNGDGTFSRVQTDAVLRGSTLGRGDSVTTVDYDLDGNLDLFITNGSWPAPLTNEGVQELLRNNGNDNNWLQIDLIGTKSNRDAVGAITYVTAGGITQKREQNGGVHRFSQNHSRLHFGLGEYDLVEKIEIVWPDGSRQIHHNISANQLIEIQEAGASKLVPGFPTPSDGLRVWRATYDGPTHLSTVGDNFSVTVLTDTPITATGHDIENEDLLSTFDFGFKLDAKSIDGADTIEFDAPIGSEALISVDSSRGTNPRQLKIGGASEVLTPAGWILDGPITSQVLDTGLNISTNGSLTEFQWRGDRSHRATLDIFSSQAAQFTPIALESRGDKLTTTENRATVNSTVKGGFDGLSVDSISPIGFVYEQDGLLQPSLVGLSNPNAYRLPTPSPNDRPIYDSATEAGLFIWRNQQLNLWQLRASAGGSFERFTGQITANSAIKLVQTKYLEDNDNVSVEGNSLTFDLAVGGAGQDGITFRAKQGAILDLNLISDNGNIAIGAERWATENNIVRLI